MLLGMVDESEKKMIQNIMFSFRMRVLIPKVIFEALLQSVFSEVLSPEPPRKLTKWQPGNLTLEKCNSRVQNRLIPIQILATLKQGLPRLVER